MTDQLESYRTRELRETAFAKFLRSLPELEAKQHLVMCIMNDPNDNIVWDAINELKIEQVRADTIDELLEFFREEYV